MEEKMKIVEILFKNGVEKTIKCRKTVFNYDEEGRLDSIDIVGIKFDGYIDLDEVVFISKRECEE